jgi:hypothetical protein
VKQYSSPFFVSSLELKYNGLGELASLFYTNNRLRNLASMMVLFVIDEIMMSRKDVLYSVLFGRAEIDVYAADLVALSYK